MRASFKVHLGIHRDYLMRAIRRAGTTDGILADFPGTVEQALDALANGPEFITSPECPTRDRLSGRCRCMHESAE